MRRWRMSGCNDVDNEGDRDRRCGRAVSGRGGRGTWGDRRSCSKSFSRRVDRSRRYVTFLMPLTVRTVSSVSPEKAIGAARYPNSLGYVLVINSC